MNVSFIADETIGVNNKREAEKGTKMDERKSWHPIKNSKFPLKICLHSHHLDATDEKKKEIDSYEGLPWPNCIFADGLLTGWWNH